MGAQKGKDLLLKLDFEQDGTFETVAGMRSRRISFDARSVDVTNADSAGRWRELLQGAAPGRSSFRTSAPCAGRSRSRGSNMRASTTAR